MTSSVFDSVTLQHLWSSEELRAVFSEENRVQKWLDFESAFSEAQAQLGIIPYEAARLIRQNAKVENIDIPAMASEMRRTKHSLFPLLKQLEKNCGDMGQWIHFGPTTQDVIDTGVVLQLREAHQIFLRDLRAISRELVRLSKTYRDTVMVGRTHGMHALPTTFGHKCAIWLDEMSRHYERFKQAEPRLFVGMLFGAVGTQASLGEQARTIEKLTFRSLGLLIADISWAPCRDRFAEYTNLLAMLGATLAKIANEVCNLQRNELGELEEEFVPGQLGSSTMPHKRNPACAENVIGISRALRYNAAMMTEAMLQEHERDGAAWKTEWKALPECCMIAGAALAQSINLLVTLRVNADAMLENLERMRGYLLSERVMMELGKKVGKQNAHEWINRSSMLGIESKLDFLKALSLVPELADAIELQDLMELTDPATYLGEVGSSIDRTISRHLEAGWMNTSSAPGPDLPC